MNTSTPLRRVVFLALLAAFCGAGAVLLRFALGGSFQLILPVNSPVNAESILGISFLLLLFLQTGTRHVELTPERTKLDLAVASYIAIIAILPYLIRVNAPLLHDSYAHVAEAANESWPKVLAYFVHPTASDRSFRPLGYLSYWFDFKWAGYDPVRWHLWSLAVHVANSCLVYILVTELPLNRFSAAVTALIFAIHGSRPEAVSWTAARFDLLAAFFVLLSLIALNRYLDRKQSRAYAGIWYAAMLCFTVLAVLSKESAYCLPLLAVGLLPFKDATARKDLLRAAGLLFVVCGLIFLYRFWLLEGVGGYRTAAGQTSILQFSAIHTIKALFFRQWAFFFFPINWSADLTIWLKSSVVLMLIVMLGLVIWSQARRRLLFAAILLIFLAELPVQHLLLMTADLAGARVLYLPVLGLALFWGILVQGCQRSAIRHSLAAGLLLFQFIALNHNLAIWCQVAFLSQKTCRAIGAELARDPRPIIVRHLPETWHGVFFLRSGFAQCVSVNSPAADNRIYIEKEERPPSVESRIFSWNNSTGRFEELARANR